MTKNFNHRALAVSQKVYGWLLRAYPAAHRQEYGPAMAQLFRDQCRDAWVESQTWGLVKLWLRVFPDLVSTSIREQLAALQERKSMKDKIASLSHDRTTPTAIFIRVALAVFLVTVIAATLITFILPETYASTARIKVEPDTLVFNGQQDGDPRAQTKGMLSEGDFRDIRSDSVLEAVVSKLHLNATWGKKYFNGETLKTAQTLDLLKSRVQTAWITRGYAYGIYSIVAFSDDKDEAAQIANAIVDAYQAYRLEANTKMMEKVAAIGPSAVKQINHPITILEQAQPRLVPVRPNKPLNLLIGVVAGGVLGLLAGGASVLVAFRFGNRGRKNIASA